MAFPEVTTLEVKEILRLWLLGAAAFVRGVPSRSKTFHVEQKKYAHCGGGLG